MKPAARSCVTHQLCGEHDREQDAGTKGGTRRVYVHQLHMHEAHMRHSKEPTQKMAVCHGITHARMHLLFTAAGETHVQSQCKRSHPVTRRTHWLNFAWLRIPTTVAFAGPGHNRDVDIRPLCQTCCMQVQHGTGGLHDGLIAVMTPISTAAAVCTDHQHNCMLRTGSSSDSLKGDRRLLCTI